MTDQLIPIRSGVVPDTSGATPFHVEGTNFPIEGYEFGLDSNDEIYFRFKALGYTSGNIVAKFTWYALTASSGNTAWGISIGVITPNTDTQDIETNGLATENTFTDSHLGTTNKRVHEAEITISNLDSLAADDEVVLRFRRVSGAADTMTGEARVFNVLHLNYS